MRAIARKKYGKQVVLGMVCLLALWAAPLLAQEGWTTPVPVTEINTDYYEEWTPFLSADDLTLYFARVRNLSPSSPGKIYAATRPTPEDPFSEPELVLSGAMMCGPWVSPDNLRMYYGEGYSTWGVKMSERASVNDPWPQGTWLSELSGISSYVGIASLTQDELNIVFSVTPGNPDYSYDLWTGSRASISSPFGNFRKLTEICSALSDKDASLSPDGLTMIFSSDRNHQGTFELFEATRPSLSDPFGNVEHLSLFDSPVGGSKHPSLSADGTALYYMKDLGVSSRDIYVSYYVPEPGSLVIMGLGGTIAALRRRR